MDCDCFTVSFQLCLYKTLIIWTAQHRRGIIYCCSPRCTVSVLLAAAYATEMKIYSFFDFLHAYSRELLRFASGVMQVLRLSYLSPHTRSLLAADFTAPLLFFPVVLQRSKPSTECFTNAKETKPQLIGVDLWTLFVVTFQPNLTMTFCLMLLILLPVVCHYRKIMKIQGPRCKSIKSLTSNAITKGRSFLSYFFFFVF